MPLPRRAPGAAAVPAGASPEAPGALSVKHFRGTREHLMGTVAKAPMSFLLGKRVPGAPRGEGGSEAMPPLTSLSQYPGHPGPQCPG